MLAYLENSKEKYICNTALSVSISNEVNKRKIQGKKRKMSSWKGFIKPTLRSLGLCRDPIRSDGTDSVRVEGVSVFMADKVNGEAGCEIQGESTVSRLSSTLLGDSLAKSTRADMSD